MTSKTITHAQSLWTDEERATLSVIADLLIPAGQGMPAASQAGVAGDGIDEVGTLRPDLVQAAKMVTGQFADAAPSDLDELRELAKDHFAPLSELLASAYFLRPEVADAIGYRQRIEIPLDSEATREAEFSDLVAPVLGRGNVWRTTPSGQRS
ncbi:hypothetical protein [Nocardioides albus]|uniref:Gluconate 2-dehydrogenase subunit 3 family protein n=1 Tax=Nocardioides albus TaxID=1841 RepID=A0A7W5FBL7_9ACTN|nr:hypothetical protein [Nocardioides albus]MBB3092321.1 hypothetical protein [Nocardioides albus]GGU47195.1 hypothetical protein GCM10007979_52780 [Nocardioides albus]